MGGRYVSKQETERASTWGVFKSFARLGQTMILFHQQPTVTRTRADCRDKMAGYYGHVPSYQVNNHGMNLPSPNIDFFNSMMPPSCGEYTDSGRKRNLSVKFAVLRATSKQTHTDSITDRQCERECHFSSVEIWIL